MSTIVLAPVPASVLVAVLPWAQAAVLAEAQALALPSTMVLASVPVSELV